MRGATDEAPNSRLCGYTKFEAAVAMLRRKIEPEKDAEPVYAHACMS